MLEFCDIMLEFYPKEITKTEKRIKHFQKVKKVLGTEVSSIPSCTRFGIRATSLQNLLRCTLRAS